MTRREYLTALNQYLVTMSESEKTAILKEYDDHYRKGFEAGKTEAQISASLGSPYDVANEFLAGRRPKVPSYPPRTAAESSSTSAYQPRTTAQNPAASAYQPRTTAQNPAASSYPTEQQQSYQAPAYQTQPQQPYQTPAYQTQPQQSYQAPTYQTQPQQSYQAPTYQTQPQQSYQAPTYPTQPQQQNHSQYVRSTPAYVDYDRAAEERDYSAPERQRATSNYNTTGLVIVILLCVILIPTLGSAIVGLLIGLYSLIVAFPTTGVALIAAGGALSAKSLWICLGLIFIGISFLFLTGLIVMAAIEGTKLLIKLIRYIVKECKKMIKEGSF